MISKEQLAALPDDELRQVAQMSATLIERRREDNRRDLWDCALSALRKYYEECGEICVSFGYEDHKISLKNTKEYDSPGWLCIEGGEENDD